MDTGHTSQGFGKCEVPWEQQGYRDECHLGIFQASRGNKNGYTESQNIRQRMQVLRNIPLGCRLPPFWNDEGYVYIWVASNVPPPTAGTLSPHNSSKVQSSPVSNEPPSCH